MLKTVLNTFLVSETYLECVYSNLSIAQQYSLYKQDSKTYPKDK